MNEIESAIVYRLLSIKGVGRATANKLLGRLAGNGSRLADLVADSCNSSALNGLLNREQIGQLFIAKDRIADQVQKVIADEGGFLTWADERYPKQLIETLRDNAPPILSYKGNLNLLASRSVGFCGSRKASERGLETARDCAEQIASTDIAIVSGNAAGVDTAAHFTALNSNGSTIIVLPEGILRFRIRSDLRKVWDWSRVLVISEFEPGITWNSGNAMQRNLTIIGLSDVMIVVEAGEEGGTMACGISTLNLRRPLFAPVYSGMPESAAGNQILIEKGAKPLLRSKSTGRAKLDALLEQLSTSSETYLNSEYQRRLSFL